MTEIEVTCGRLESGGYKVDMSRGGHDCRLSAECFSRPDDEKCRSPSELFALVKSCGEQRRTRTVEMSTGGGIMYRRGVGSYRPHQAR